MTLPIFEYECAKCKNTFELLVSGGASEAAKCPECLSDKVIKLFSCFSVGGGATAREAGSSSSGACSTCMSRNCSSCG